MIGYITLGTNDIERSTAFYDLLMEELGYGRAMATDSFIAWGVHGSGAVVSVTRPFDGKPATVGNGTMVALLAKDKEHVERLYNVALSAGGADESRLRNRHSFRPSARC